MGNCPFHSLQQLLIGPAETAYATHVLSLAHPDSQAACLRLGERLRRAPIAALRACRRRSSYLNLKLARVFIGRIVDRFRLSGRSE
jgi:hypothetical protein